MAESPKLEVGKIFVGGLSWDTNKETLIEYFQKYGDVTDGVIMVDSVNKMPRGFGFVTFKDSESVQAVMNDPQHILDGKKIDPKAAITKDHHASSQLGKSTSIEKKVFVGGLPHGCLEEDIKEFFQKFGEVTEVDVKMDRTTHKPRGFAFVEYAEGEGASNATTEQFRMFKDKRIEIRPAENRTPGGSPGGSSGTTYANSFPSGTNYSGGQTAQHGTTYGYTNPPFNQYFYQQGATSSYMPAAGTAYTPQTYTPSHATPQQSVYPSQASSYQPNGYQQNYSNTSYAAQTFQSSGYGQQGYSTSAGYPQGYSSSYPAPTESGQAAPYGQTQSNSSYYGSTYPPPQGYPSERYNQPPNPRNW